jgi:hypothetical protein
VNETTALTGVLNAEHAALYAYGVLGAKLDDATRAAALGAFDAHRSRRDQLEEALRTRKLPVPGPAASYQVSVAGRAQALALATRVEEEVGVTWRDLVASTDDEPLRRLGVRALQECAVQAVRWRLLTKTNPVTVALPGAT